MNLSSSSSYSIPCTIKFAGNNSSLCICIWRCFHSCPRGTSTAQLAATQSLIHRHFNRQPATPSSVRLSNPEALQQQQQFHSKWQEPSYPLIHGKWLTYRPETHPLFIISSFTGLRTSISSSFCIRQKAPPTLARQQARMYSPYPNNSAAGGHSLGSQQ